MEEDASVPSVAEFVAHVGQFARVCGTAEREAVRQWDRTFVERAFGWAEYVRLMAEMIYDAQRDTASVDRWISDQLERAPASEADQPTRRVLTVRSLSGRGGDSSGATGLLLRTLLLNPDTPNDLVRATLQHVLGSASAVAPGEPDCAAGRSAVAEEGAGGRVGGGEAGGEDAAAAQQAAQHAAERMGGAEEPALDLDEEEEHVVAALLSAVRRRATLRLVHAMVLSADPANSSAGHSADHFADASLPAEGARDGGALWAAAAAAATASRNLLAPSTALVSARSIALALAERAAQLPRHSVIAAAG